MLLLFYYFFWGGIEPFSDHTIRSPRIVDSLCLKPRCALIWQVFSHGLRVPELKASLGSDSVSQGLSQLAYAVISPEMGITRPAGSLDRVSSANRKQKISDFELV